MSWKCESRVVTLSAKPWRVYQRDRCTPSAAIFRAPPALELLDPHAGVLLDARRGQAVLGERADQHLLEPAHVAAHVLLAGLEVHERVADDLPGAVVGDVAAAIGLERRHALAPPAPPAEATMLVA